MSENLWGGNLKRCCEECSRIEDGEDELVAMVYGYGGEGCGERAEYIVRAVNCHERLVNIAKEALYASRNPARVTMLHKLIAEAEGKE